MTALSPIPHLEAMEIKQGHVKIAWLNPGSNAIALRTLQGSLAKRLCTRCNAISPTHLHGHGVFFDLLRPTAEVLDPGMLGYVFAIAGGDGEVKIKQIPRFEGDRFLASCRRKLILIALWQAWCSQKDGCVTSCQDPPCASRRV